MAMKYIKPDQGRIVVNIQRQQYHGVIFAMVHHAIFDAVNITWYRRTVAQK